MSVLEIVAAGVRNARSARPKVDHTGIEVRLRRANRTVGRSLGPISWSGSLPAFIRTSADLALEGWTIERVDRDRELIEDLECPVHPHPVSLADDCRVDL